MAIAYSSLLQKTFSSLTADCFGIYQKLSSLSYHLHSQSIKPLLGTEIISMLHVQDFSFSATAFASRTPVLRASHSSLLYSTTTLAMPLNPSWPCLPHCFCALYTVQRQWLGNSCIGWSDNPTPFPLLLLQDFLQLVKSLQLPTQAFQTQPECIICMGTGWDISSYRTELLKLLQFLQ